MAVNETMLTKWLDISKGEPTESQLPCNIGAPQTCAVLALVFFFFLRRLLIWRVRRLTCSWRVCQHPSRFSSRMWSPETGGHGVCRRVGLALLNNECDTQKKLDDTETILTSFSSRWVRRVMRSTTSELNGGIRQTNHDVPWDMIGEHPWTHTHETISI